MQTGRRRVGDGVAVELILEPCGETVVGRLVRPARAGGWHHPGPKFPHDPFPRFRVLPDVRHIQIVKCDFPCSFLP